MQVDKRRSERQFVVGDYVYLKLVPYELQSLAPYNFHKLQTRYNGSYEVIEKVGEVAYKLRFHVNSKIHLVFHVSYLNEQLGNNGILHSKLPQVMEDGLSLLNPKEVLSRSIYKKGASTSVELLVHWLGQEATDATWEDFEDF